MATSGENRQSDSLKKDYRNSEVLEPLVVEDEDDDTGMIRLTGDYPINSEPQLSKLMESGFQTTVSLHYIRNHGAVPTTATWENWTVEVSGKVKQEVKFTMDQLVAEFPNKAFPVTLVCSGNRRMEQNMVADTKGFDWGPAVASTSVWRGIPLCSILEKCGILTSAEGAVNVCFEGEEDLVAGGTGSKYGTSIKREIAMDPSRDIILAYEQNDERLTADHGFPVRVIIPGFIGGRMVKWLRRIIVSEAESTSYYHRKDNKLFPSHVTSDLADSEDWWDKPEYIINELNINSVITTPSHEEKLQITQGTYTLKGYAYSGGGKKVTRVEVTMDGGETWQVCTLVHDEKPNEYDKYWCWCLWSLTVNVLDLVRAKEIAVRAWDQTLNMQPKKLIWNLMGLLNNCWFTVKTNLYKASEGETEIEFQHPTEPGNKFSGWMGRKRPRDPDSVPVEETEFSMCEVEKHNTEDSAWIVIGDQVYDCTKLIDQHPGGRTAVASEAGKNGSATFNAIHDQDAWNELQKFRIGALKTTGDTNDATNPPNSN